MDLIFSPFKVLYILVVHSHVPAVLCCPKKNVYYSRLDELIFILNLPLLPQAVFFLGSAPREVVWNPFRQYYPSSCLRHSQCTLVSESHLIPCAYLPSRSYASFYHLGSPNVGKLNPLVKTVGFDKTHSLPRPPVRPGSGYPYVDVKLLCFL